MNWNFWPILYFHLLNPFSPLYECIMVKSGESCIMFVRIIKVFHVLALSYLSSSIKWSEL